MTIEEYFLTDYRTDKSELNQIDILIKETLPAFLYVEKVSRKSPDDGMMVQDIESWPYEIPKLSNNKSSQKFSACTVSMILYVLSKIINVDDIVKDIDDVTNRKEDGNKVPLREVWKQQFKLLFAKLSVENIGKLDLGSTTFGKNNVFTLGYSMGVLNDIYAKNSDYAKNKLVNGNEEIELIIEQLIKKTLIKLTNYFLNNNKDSDEKINFFFSGGEQIDDTDSISEKRFLEHPLHTARAVHIFSKIKEFVKEKTERESKKIPSDDIEILGEQAKIATIGTLIDLIEQHVTKDTYEYFLHKIHAQLSHSENVNGNFDPAELVFSLEGLLAIDTMRGIRSFDYNLINRVFHVIEHAQSKSPYWRPHKPFAVISNSKSMVLVPFSIDMANSLLRICKLLETPNDSYFSKYISLFKKYTDWLKSRKTHVTVADKKKTTYSGWHYEHMNKQELINPWETADVLNYLLKYREMLQAHIAMQCMLLSNLQEKLFDKPKDNWEETTKEYDTFQFDPEKEKEKENDNKEKQKQIYFTIGEKFIYPRLPKQREGDEKKK